MHNSFPTTPPCDITFSSELRLPCDQIVHHSSLHLCSHTVPLTERQVILFYSFGLYPFWFSLRSLSCRHRGTPSIRSPHALINNGLLKLYTKTTASPVVQQSLYPLWKSYLTSLFNHLNTIIGNIRHRPPHLWQACHSLAILWLCITCLSLVCYVMRRRFSCIETKAEEVTGITPSPAPFTSTAYINDGVPSDNYKPLFEIDSRGSFLAPRIKRRRLEKDSISESNTTCLSNENPVVPVSQKSKIYSVSKNPNGTVTKYLAGTATQWFAGTSQTANGQNSISVEKALHHPPQQYSCHTCLDKEKKK